MLLRRLEGGANAGGRLVHRIGQEVDADVAAHTQLGGQAHSFDAASLVELVTVVVVHLAQDVGRATAIQAPHQRFVGKHLAAAHINDGLKRHAEINCQRRPILAGFARGNGGGAGCGGHWRILLESLRLPGCQHRPATKEKNHSAISTGPPFSSARWYAGRACMRCR